jgi:hypothetical protein
MLCPGGGGGDTLAGLTKKDQNEVAALNPSSPRRARQAEHEFGYKTPFCEELPDMMQNKIDRRGQQLAAPYGKNMGGPQGLQIMEAHEVKMQIRSTQLRYVEKAIFVKSQCPSIFTLSSACMYADFCERWKKKAAPDLEQKPPPALSVESGDTPKAIIK